VRAYGRRYARERRLFEHWARWYERQWDESLGLPRVTWLAKLMQYGERLGPVRSVNEYLPPDPSGAEAVTAFMDWLKTTCPPVHAALLARHRGICTGRGGPAGVQRFRRLCEQGYRLLKDRMAETM
jgi:hypothetical protein